MEKNGYLTRLSDKEDKRATKIRLSPKGYQLIEDTKNITVNIEKQYASIIGEQEFKQLKKSLLEIHHHYCPEFHLKNPKYKPLNSSLLVYLEAITQYIQKRLMRECINAGFDNLKLSYNMVLPYLAGENKSINELRKIHGVSKQAIGQIANTLESYGYLNSALDKKDKRVKILYLTEKGQNLIKIAFDTLAAIENEIALIIGESETLSLINSLKKIEDHENKLFLSEAHLLNWVASVVNNTNANTAHQKLVENILGEKKTKELEQSLKKINIFNR